MGQASHKPVMTTADYLVWEGEQTERHEFVDGETFAMAGAEDRHVTIAINLAFALLHHLAGTPCQRSVAGYGYSVVRRGLRAILA